MPGKDVDCLVIGSGMGGLSAAALLAHHGYRVLVAEKRSRLGGRFSTEEIDGFKCPTGALIIQRGTELEKTFRVTGAPFEIVDCTNISWKIGDAIYPLLGEGVGRTLRAALTKLRWRHYRFGAAGLWRIGQAMVRMAGRSLRNRSRGGHDNLGREPGRGAMTYRAWMESHTDDPVIIQANHALISSLFSAINDDECPAEDVFEFFASMANPAKMQRFGYAPRGNIELMQNLAGVVTGRGGDVMAGTEVKALRVRGGRVTGAVLLDGGQEVEVSARVVISNAGPRETVEIVGEEHFPSDYVGQIRRRLRPIPIVMGLIESDVPLLDRKGLVVVTGTQAIVTAVTLTLLSDEIGPPGKHLMWTCGTPLSCLEKIDREREIRRNEEDLERAFPLYREHGRVLRWVVKDIDHDLPCMRTWPGYDMPVATPIPNLFNVGDGVKAPGWTGSPACAKSAWIVVDRVRRWFPPLAGR